MITPTPIEVVEYIHKSRKYAIRVWQNKTRWYWVAARNSASANSRDEALTLARRWIKYGQ